MREIETNSRYKQPARQLLNRRGKNANKQTPQKKIANRAAKRSQAANGSAGEKGSRAKVERMQTRSTVRSELTREAEPRGWRARL